MGWFKDLFTSDSREQEFRGDENKYPSDWDSRRKEVYKADDYTCQVCGTSGGPTEEAELHAHHKIPISEGGSHKKGNLTTLCRKCHNKIHNGDLSLKGNYTVVVEAAWLVHDVDNVDDAIGVAVREAGKRLNKDGKDYVDVEVGYTDCPGCGEPFDSAFIAADTSLVGLVFEIDVFNADSPVEAREIAENTLRDSLRDVPTKVIAVVDEE